MAASRESFAGNIERFTGFADLYDRHRAPPPAALAELVRKFTGFARPALVVDLGSGTGLSTRFWADKAERVIGIEPTPDMRHQAEAATAAKNVSYREGFSHATGLPEHGASVVCAMQSLHWMEPVGTFAEIARVLAPGGIFLACDYDWPPATGFAEADAAFLKCVEQSRARERASGLEHALKQWDKPGHLGRMTASGRFRETGELVVEHREPGDAERLVGLLLSQGHVMGLLKRGVREEELAIDALRAIAQRTLGATPRPWTWRARVRFGIV